MTEILPDAQRVALFIQRGIVAGVQKLESLKGSQLAIDGELGQSIGILKNISEVNDAWLQTFATIVRANQGSDGLATNELLARLDGSDFSVDN